MLCGTDEVHLPPGLESTIVLEMPGGPALEDPQPDVVAHTVRKALGRNSHVLLRRDERWYVRLGAGPAVGLVDGGFAAEYRDGSADTLYRYETPDLAEVVELADSFTRVRGRWETPFGW